MQDERGASTERQEREMDAGKMEADVRQRGALPHLSLAKACTDMLVA